MFYLENQKKLDQLWQIVERGDGSDQQVMDLFRVAQLIRKESEPDMLRMARTVNKIAAMRARESGSKEYYLLYKSSLQLMAPYDFDSYLLFVEYNREPERRFYLPRRKVLRPLVRDLQALEDGELELLTLSLPPGIGKSTLGIFYLTWLMGRSPEKASLASGHSSELTRSFYDGVLEILTDPDYLWAATFPAELIQHTNVKSQKINIGHRKRFSTLTCRSIDGSLTGATRCNKLLYADDLVSGIEEAMSITRMNTLWHKFINDLNTRAMEGCKRLIIATRWSVHDPIGRMELLNDTNPKAKFIRVPALNEAGESNFNYQYNVGFSTETYHDLRNTMEDIEWRALYLNDPIEREGQLYHPDDLRRYYRLPEEEPDAIVAICDTAEGGGDDTFLPVGYLYGSDVYIEDCVCSDALPDVTDILCADMLIKHNVKQAQFESNAAGGRTADKVNDLVVERGGKTRITKKRTTANKLTKIIVNSSDIKANFLFKDAKLYEPKSPYGRMMARLTSFTQRGKNKYDDVPDGLAQLNEFIQTLQGMEVRVFQRPF